MKRKHLKKREALFLHPPSANLMWSDIEGLFKVLGAEIIEREGSRVGARLFGGRRVFLR